MKLLRMRFSQLIIDLLLLFCIVTAVPCQSRSQAPDNEVKKFAPLGLQEESLLFKAGFSAFGDYYSGLVLIKDGPDDGAVRIVFLSELGLNLLDMAYRNDEFEVMNVQEFLNRPSLINTLQKDFRCLLLDLSMIDEFKVKLKDEGVTETLKFRHKSQRYAYSYKEGLGPFHIRRRSGLFGRVDIQMSGVETRKILIEHRGIRLRILLTELKRQ